MNKIKIFVVFHKTFSEQLSLNQFTADEIKKWIIPYAVNETKLPKKIILKNGSSVELSDPKNMVIIEYQLPEYEPMYQARGFMETSAYIHIEKNNLYQDADWIGICQYDMRWTKRAVKLLRSIEKNDSGIEAALANKFLSVLGFRADNKKNVYCQIAGKLMDSKGQFNNMACVKDFNWDYLLRSYNQFFQSEWQFKDLINEPLTLWQTYLMPRQLFLELAQWLSTLAIEVEPWANKAPYCSHWGVLGGYTERAESLFMALRHHAKEINIRPLYLEHDAQIATDLGISKDHYI